jgi:hypothetical protein
VLCVTNKKAAEQSVRALDAGESARFTTLLLASSFFCFQALFTLAHLPITQTVQAEDKLESPSLNRVQFGCNRSTTL